MSYRQTKLERAIHRDSDIEVALRTMKSRLELSQVETELASYHQNLVREGIEKSLGGFQSSFLTGSYARATAIAPLKDIDVFVIIDPRCRADLLANGPEYCINAVRAAAADALRRLRDDPFPQRRSAAVTFVRSGLKVELVPAFPTNQSEVYQIADSSVNRWLFSAPRKHKELSTKSNELSGGLLKPAIKMIKAWKRHHNLPIKSFHLEAMCYNAYHGPPKSYSHALALAFHHLAVAIQTACPDPAGVGHEIDSDMTSRDRSIVAAELGHAARLAAEAVQLEKGRRRDWAHNRWRRIFGELYPRKDWG